MGDGRQRSGNPAVRARAAHRPAARPQRHPGAWAAFWTVAAVLLGAGTAAAAGSGDGADLVVVLVGGLGLVGIAAGVLAAVLNPGSGELADPTMGYTGDVHSPVDAGCNDASGDGGCGDG